MRPWGGEMPPQSSPGGKNMAIQLNDNALTTLEAVKTFIGIPEDDVDEARDNTLIQLINAASAWLETQLGRKLGLHTYIQKCAGPGTQRLVLEHYPIISIEQIKSLTTGEIISGYDFDQDGEIGVVYREDGWTYQVAQQEAIIENDAAGLSAFSISDVSWTFDKNISETWQTIISKYRRW